MADTKSKSNAQMLADALESMRGPFLGDGFRTVRADEIAAELRRLDAVEAERDALASQKDLLIEAMRDEMDEGLRLRKMGGAAPDENITAMTERVIRERDALRVEVEQWRTKLTAVMPAGMKDWHENNPVEWPEVAARVIENQREQYEFMRAEVERLRAAAGQASFCLRELLPSNPDALMTVRMLDAARGAV